MAKIKISELASELGCEAKELIAFLQEKGIEAKRSNSSIEETDADVARKNFGKKAKKADDADKAAKEEKTKKAKAEEPAEEPKKAEAPKAEEPKAEKKEAPKAEAPRPEAARPAEGSKLPPKKKKNIIVVTNNNMGRGGQGGQSQGGNRDFNGQRPGNRNDRGQNGPQDRNGQGGGRFSGKGDNRFGGGKFDKNAGRGGFDGPSEKQGPGHRDEDRRRQGQEKDKRNKKDLAYEQEEMMPRSKRVGRFIKPEVKKVEEPEEQIKVISIPEKVSIKELAEKMKMQPSVIIKKLFMAGQVSTVNTELTYEEAENIAIEYDIICEKEIPVDIIEELLKEDEDAPETLKKRPPVVCVMGHVDHGKTSLLDAIRKTSVTDREAGGITQRIGAYTVSINGQKITFLDTPGHEAFTAMRMRGANSTDIAVLVVAADDGVMPQTVEAINHAKAAEVEIIVAVNKIDKPNANIDRVKQEMTEYGLISTDWGGTTEFVPVSAKSGEGIDTLLETIILTSDILELKANPDREARGLVLEARLDKGRGPVANVLVQKGTLHVGDFISAGASSGKVRAMVDDKGNKLKEALPSQPVEILGLSDVPNAGEVFLGHETDKQAKQYANTYLQQHKKDLIEETKAKMSLDDLYSKIEEGRLQELNIIIKADVQGSVEALKQSLLKLSNDEVVVKVIHGGVGAINESDVTLAAASSAIIIGFDVRPDATAKSMADHEGVEIKLYKVIYQAIEEIEYAMKGMLAPIYEERITGHAEVRQIFKASKVGNIAGAFVKDGIIKKDCKVRISREGEQIFEGDLASLKRFKDDVKEVKEGFECGLVFDGFDQIHEGDTVEAYEMVEVPRT
ncbi:translation initiation factor IF-2 [Butyrivibrio sp. CB08]|uniref:translation initiation factor IF-2 n=1 Tax=Butyrivibrio sp. CB08 TaxID=2364879 RepID=UPI000EA8A44B|nr:translation initiation factor IF-2 [Butyrivibrio sp. CB08]RKM62115.1 translation initiation factor IF-2 [Butyrivibrio sp. CB08]